jgi:hypothetical protein
VSLNEYVCGMRGFSPRLVGSVPVWSTGHLSSRHVRELWIPGCHVVYDWYSIWEGQGTVRTGCSRCLLVPRRVGVFFSEVRASSQKLRTSSDVTPHTFDGIMPPRHMLVGQGPVCWYLEPLHLGPCFSRGPVGAGQSVGSTDGNRMYSFARPMVAFGGGGCAVCKFGLELNPLRMVWDVRFPT